jgi:hypothetical protein
MSLSEMVTCGQCGGQYTDKGLLRHQNLKHNMVVRGDVRAAIHALYGEYHSNSSDYNRAIDDVLALSVLNDPQP